MDNNLHKTHLLQVLGVYSYNLEDILEALNDALSNNSNNANYLLNIKAKEGAYKLQILEPKTKSSNRKIIIPLQDGFEVINKVDVLYCEADDNYTKIYLRNEEKYLVSKTLKYFEDVLGDFNFVRVHKSYLVNINDIVKYYRKGKTGSILLNNKKEITVSASKKANLMSYFKQ
ncbi:MAG: LytTR family DNA-binding domain-containing protein [Algibacter sp.]